MRQTTFSQQTIHTALSLRQLLSTTLENVSHLILTYWLQTSRLASRLKTIGVARILDWGGPNQKYIGEDQKKSLHSSIMICDWVRGRNLVGDQFRIGEPNSQVTEWGPNLKNN